MELINGNSEIIRDFFQSMDRILDGISRLAKENRPHLNGEKFLSNREAAKCLKVSIRTLQEWRDTGVIPYIQIKGKIIYRQSDIKRLLQTIRKNLFSLSDEVIVLPGHGEATSIGYEKKHNPFLVGG